VTPVTCSVARGKPPSLKLSHASGGSCGSVGSGGRRRCGQPGKGTRGGELNKVGGLSKPGDGKTRGDPVEAMSWPSKPRD